MRAGEEGGGIDGEGAERECVKDRATVVVVLGRGNGEGSKGEKGSNWRWGGSCCSFDDAVGSGRVRLLLLLLMSFPLLLLLLLPIMRASIFSSSSATGGEANGDGNIPTAANWGARLG